MMMLFRVSLFPALVCAAMHFHSAGTLLSTAEVTGALEKGDDSEVSESHKGKHDVQDPAGIVPVTNKVGGEQLKGKYESQKLSSSQSMREGHTFSLRGHGHEKPAGVAGSLTRTPRKEGMSNLIDAEALEKEEGIKYSVPTIGGRMPLNLTLPPLLKSRSFVLEQANEGDKEKLNVSESKKGVGQTSAEELVSVDSAAPAVTTSQGKDSVENVRPKATPRKFHSKERAAGRTGEQNGVVSSKNGASATSASEDREKYSDNPLPGTRIHRGIREVGVQGRASHCPRRRSSNSDSAEGLSKEACDKSQMNQEDVEAPVAEKGFGSRQEFGTEAKNGSQKRGVHVNHTEARLRSARYPSFFHTTFVPAQSVIEVPCSSSPRSPCAVSQSSSDAPKGKRRQPMLRENGSRVSLTSEPVKKSLPQADVQTPKVTSQPNQQEERSASCGCQPSCACQSNVEKSGRQGSSQLKQQQERSASCKCQPTCACRSNEDKSEKLGAGADTAEARHLKQTRKMASEEVDGKGENSTSLEMSPSENTDQVKLVRGSLPVNSGARVRGEPFHPETLLPVSSPTAQLTTSPTQQQLVHRSSAASPAPLAQLEELFLNVGGQLGHSPLATELLHAGPQRQHPHANDGVTVQH